MTTSHDNPPIIILGAARSGTKLLRSLVVATGHYAEVPFDVNYIWRYGNESCRDDVLSAERLTQRTRRFIRDQLPRCARRSVHCGETSLPFIEKTVSNVLRLPFVVSVYPEAKFITIVRDGRDVAESAARCWREPPSADYLLAKLRSFPWHRCAPYAWKYMIGLARQRLRFEPHLRTWGPRYPGIDADLNQYSLLEVCARQWIASIEHYEQSRHLIPAGQLLELRYELLVRETDEQVHRICDFLRIENRESALRFARQTICADQVASNKCVTAEKADRMTKIMYAALDRWGYLLQSARAA
ncbi:MAG: sulfotransferase [Pirellulales bacterium]